MPLDRRSFLATTATLAAAVTGGCTGCAASPTASLRMVAEDDAGLARQALLSYGDEPPGEHGGRAALAERVVEDGSATVEDREEPLPTDRPVVVNDGVYRFSAERTDSRELRAFDVEMNPIRTDEGEETPGPDDRIRFADLPEVDRAQFERLGFTDERPIGIGTRFSYRPEDVDDSVLVPTPEYSVVVWPDGPARIGIGDSSTYTVYTYEVTAERVTSAVEYGAALRREFAFDLGPLPEAQRDIVEAAIDPKTPAPDGDDHSGYHVAADEEPPAAFRALAERFRDETAVGDGDQDPGVYGDGSSGGDADGTSNLGGDEDGTPRTDGDEDGTPGMDGDRGESAGVSGDYVVTYRGSTYWTELFAPASVFTGTATES